MIPRHGKEVKAMTEEQARALIDSLSYEEKVLLLGFLKQLKAGAA